MAPIRLQVQEHYPQRYPGQVCYIKNDYAFGVLPERATDIDILLEDLSLLFREEKGILRACRIMGYHPATAWIQRPLQVPSFIVGDLILLDPPEDYSDIVRWIEFGQWKTCVDPDTGWVCFGDEQVGKHAQAVEFASDLVAVIERNDLKALWIKPIIVETLHEY